MVVDDVFSSVPGQDAAVAQLRAAASRPVHAYLLVAPPGSGERALAAAFAAALLCPDRGCGHCDVCRRAVAGVHPDVVVVEREGASISVDAAREISTLAMRSPTEGARKVLVLADFHLVQQAGPALLKTIEEPSATTVFVVLAEQVPRELVTIASRCVRIDLAPLDAPAIAAVLRREGVDTALADEIAAMAGGDLDRARLLAADPGFRARRELWRSVPSRLDGHGSTVAVLVDELLAATEAVVEPVKARQEETWAELVATAERYGQRPPSRKQADERFRREQRRLRTDELRAGLVELVAVFRAVLADGPSSARRAAAEAVAVVDAADEALVRNPNESLLLQALLVRLSGLVSDLPYFSPSPHPPE